MQINQLITLIASLSVSAILHANVHSDSSLLKETQDNAEPIKAISTLHSLKGLSSKTSYQTPFVRELKNRHHVRSLFVETHDLPIVDIQLTFNAGSARDEEIAQGLYGLSNMVAQLMPEGTEQYSAQQIASTFENIGAQFSIQSYRDMFIVRLRVLSDPDKLTPATDMMIEVLNNASFKTQSLDLNLNNMKVGQKQLSENPNRVLATQFNRSVYQAHPYAEPIAGTYGSIQKINSSWLKKFRDQFLVSQNMNIAITGDLTSKEATKLTSKIANQLRQGKSAKVLPTPQSLDGFNIIHIPFDSTQAYVSMGHITTTRGDPDRLALEIANRILGGGGFNSLLTKELRVKRGYTYGITSHMSFSQAPGLFNIGYSTRQDQLLESIQIAHKTLVDFTQQPIDTHILEETRMGVLRAFPMNYSSNALTNAQLGAMGFYQEPTDYLAQYSKNLLKITAYDVQNAIKRHLHPNRLTLVIVSKELDQTALLQILHDNLQSSTF